jgi:hypothetical protein
MPINARIQLERKIEAKRQEILQYETKILECNAFLQGLQEALKVLPRDPGDAGAPILREGSNIAKARDVLLKAGKSMHVKDILKELGKENTRNNRAALVGSITTYVRRGEIFTKTGANTFGVVEHQRDASELPDDWGTENGKTDNDSPF